MRGKNYEEKNNLSHFFILVLLVSSGIVYGLNILDHVNEIVGVQKLDSTNLKINYNLDIATS